MKSTSIRLLVSAASTLMATAILTSASPSAYGQERMAATVPFSFHVASTTVEAGRYDIDSDATDPKVMLLTNLEDKSFVRMLTRGDVHNSKGIHVRLTFRDVSDTRPRLVFRCGSTGCTLSQIFTGEEGWELPANKLTGLESEHLEMVYLVRCLRTSAQSNNAGAQ